MIRGFSRLTFLLMLVGLAGLGQDKITLEQAVAIALKNNPRLSADRISAQVSEEFTNELRSAYYPTVVASTTAAGATADTRLAAGVLNNPIIFNRYAAGTALSLKVFVHGADTVGILDAAQKARADYVDGRAVALPMDEPKTVYRWTPH